MTLRFLVAAVVASACGWSVAAWRWRHALPATTAEAFAIPRAPRPHSFAGLATESESVLVANDMFRLPEDVARSPALSIASAVASRAIATRPSLTVKGIVGGPPWQAIVDGLPGQASGTVVQSGGTYGGVTIATVGRDSVRVRAGDTTWTLYYRKGS